MNACLCVPQKFSCINILFRLNKKKNLKIFSLLFKWYLVHKMLTANSHLAKLNICLCVLHFMFSLKDFECKDDKVLTFIGTFHYYSLIKIYDWTLQIKSPLASATLVYNGKSNILFSIVLLLLFWKKIFKKSQLKVFIIFVTSRENRPTTDN